MGISASPGPVVIFGSKTIPGQGGTPNADIGPSIVYGVWGLMDARVGYNNTRLGAIAMYGIDNPMVLDATPSTISAVNIAASQSPGAAALTLVSTTGAGITVMATATAVWGSGTIIPAGTLAIDGLPGLIQSGLAIPVVSTGSTRLAFYDPTKAIARAVRITSGGNDSGITFLVRGYDVYGYPQTERITGANAGVAAGKKAFKFISSVTPSAAAATTVSVGTSDVYGLGIRADKLAYIQVYFNSALVTSTGTFVAAVTTNPATATTGDVRGTFTTPSASDGTKTIQIEIQPSVLNIASSNPSIGLWGVTPA